MITFREVTEVSEFEKLQPQWNDLVQKNNCHVFQTHEWLYTWWSVFGKSNELYILTAWQGSELVGILPMFKDRIRLGGITLSVMIRMIGSQVRQPKEGSLPLYNPFGDYLYAIIKPDCREDVCNKFCNHLLRDKHKYEEVLFEEMPKEFARCNKLTDWPEGTNWQLSAEKDSACPAILLPDSWDELISEFSKRTRRKVRRNLKRITKEELFEYKIPTDKQDAHNAFKKMVNFHQKRWHRRGQTGVYTDKRILNFFQTIIDKFHDAGWLHIRFLEVEGKCVAVDLLYKFNNTLYLVQRGFDEDSKYSRYGPGNILLYAELKEAVTDGIKVFDFLKGVTSYKMKLANYKQQNFKYRFYPRKQTGKSSARWRELMRKYAKASRLISNEDDIVKMYYQRYTPWQATTLYARRVLDRIKDRTSN